MARRQKYKFAKKEYSKNGKISAILAGTALFIMLLSIFLAFVLQGQAGVFVGGMGLASMLLAIYGFILGVKGYSEKKCSHLFCTVGTIANGLICILYLAMVSLGAV